MEEKKTIKISLATLFLIISIIIIIIMGYFLYKLNLKNTNMISTEKKLKIKISELENRVINKGEESEKQISDFSFSEIMNILYTKNGTKVGENEYIITPSDSIYMTYEDVSGDIENIEYTDIRVIDGEIDFYINRVEPNKDISTSIKGINEEVVSIKIISVEDGVIPSAVYFLTINGNVYYINQEMIVSNNFVAKKLESLKEVISIEVADTLYSDAIHGSTTLIATIFEGEKIDVLELQDNFFNDNN